MLSLCLFLTSGVLIKKNHTNLADILNTTWQHSYFFLFSSFSKTAVSNPSHPFVSASLYFIDKIVAIRILGLQLNVGNTNVIKPENLYFNTRSLLLTPCTIEEQTVLKTNNDPST